jgi:2-amino-4-hydroxy-6-hydroxymethyldihydropteridine diphosphokinase
MTQHAIPITARAPIYETPPFGGVASLPFLNSAVTVRSVLAPEAFLQALLSIETKLGRVRQRRWDDRVIDLDILLWWPDTASAPMTWASETLTIPHPELLKRDFMLVPAAAVAGDWQHPVSKKSLTLECQQRGYHLERQS